MEVQFVQELRLNDPRFLKHVFNVTRLAREFRADTLVGYCNLGIWLII